MRIFTDNDCTEIANFQYEATLAGVLFWKIGIVQFLLNVLISCVLDFTFYKVPSTEKFKKTNQILYILPVTFILAFVFRFSTKEKIANYLYECYNEKAVKERNTIVWFHYAFVYSVFCLNLIWWYFAICMKIRPNTMYSLISSEKRSDNSHSDVEDDDTMSMFDKDYST